MGLCYTRVESKISVSLTLNEREWDPFLLPNKPYFPWVEPRLLVVFVGRTGAGKSTLINRLMNKEVAPVSRRLLSCTDEISSYSDPITRITFIDTPGFGDNRAKSDSSLCLKLSRFLYDMVDHIPILFCYCVNAQARIDMHDFRSIKLLRNFFGKNFFQVFRLIVTKGNTLTGSNHFE
jgi:GTPase Era involved in 16S rRNA processing